MLDKDFWKNPSLSLFKGTKRVGTIADLWWYESGSGRRWVTINKDNELSTIKDGDSVDIYNSVEVIAVLVGCIIKRDESNTIDLVCDIRLKEANV